jgi:acetyl-CoA C-acetyltransferase
VIALDAGLSAAGYQLDRRGRPGLQAIINACQSVGQGTARLIIPGGVESTSNTSVFTTHLRWGVGGSALGLCDSLAPGRLTAGGESHPFGATGARTTTTLMGEWKCCGARYERETMCIDGGRGLAVVVKAVA